MSEDKPVKFDRKHLTYKRYTDTDKDPCLEAWYKDVNIFDITLDLSGTFSTWHVYGCYDYDLSNSFSTSDRLILINEYPNIFKTCRSQICLYHLFFNYPLEELIEKLKEDYGLHGFEYPIIRRDYDCFMDVYNNSPESNRDRVVSIREEYTNKEGSEVFPLDID